MRSSRQIAKKMVLILSNPYLKIISHKDKQQVLLIVNGDNKIKGGCHL